jgi:GH15 family glucan-1,4-alpha-glucosidase
MTGPEHYRPIEDYGAIGNLRSVALVSRHGSIDWCCFPSVDSPSVFAALLDHRRGGRFQIGPHDGPRSGRQEYISETNVLRTWWDTGGGRLAVTDFMPLRGAITGAGEAPAAPCIYRVLHCEDGDCEVALEWSPRMDYGRAGVDMKRAGDHFVASAGAERLALAGLLDNADARGMEVRIVAGEDGGPVLRATFTLRDGVRMPLLAWYGALDHARALAGWHQALEQTAGSWREWLHSREQGERCSFAGAWQPLVDRSGLLLKLLTYPRTGAIVAAPTTSLPEKIGGVRNWDYRYTWIRDASFTAQALVALGHRQEAVNFLEFAETSSMKDDESARELHLMYTVRGAAEMPEQELPHMEGYRGSRPVRIGNKASDQFQLDIYGELLGAAYELVRLGVDLTPAQWRFLTHVADQACMRWHEPDYGIWEVRSDKQHFVHSKLMACVALDRALRISARLGLEADTERWLRTREAIRDSILDFGYDTERRAFVQAYGSQALDAANLVIPMVGFLPADDSRVQSTIDRCLEELTENGLVHRYDAEQTDDGLPGGEGAFGLTTFWLIDALALSGRIDEASALFEGMGNRANHVGLYSEEIDPGSGAFLGNFPQAFTHIGLVNSALYIAQAEGRPTPAPAPLGSSAERHEAAGTPPTTVGQGAAPP